MADDNDLTGKRSRGFDISSLDRLAVQQDVGGAFDAFARQERIAEEMRRATGSFGLHESASDRMMRELSAGSIVDRAAREAIGGGLASQMGHGRYPKPSATELAITEAHAAAAGLISGVTRSLIDTGGFGVAGGALDQARRAAEGSIGRLVGPDTASLWSHQTIGLGAAEAALATGRGRFADSDLAASVTGLRASFDDRYDRILQDIAGIGSLGSIAAGLATRRDEVLGLSTRLFDDVAGRAGRGGAASSSEALRRAHSDLLPPLRTATRSELDALVGMTSSWTALAPYPDWLARAQGGLGGLASAWVREDRPELSFEAIARLGYLGGVVANVDPREAAVTAELRTRLGDYRGQEAGAPTSDDPLVRVAEQYDRGLDPVLSSLPTRLVVVMLAPFGLRFEPEVAEEEFEIDDLIGRMLRRLEKRLLTFVQATLEAAYGDEWIMQVPGEIRGQLRRRLRKDEQEGRPVSHLLAYADFDSWTAIIGHDDNWGLFASAFGSLDALRETMARIKPIRHAAAHPRALGPEDLFTLAADGVRLLRWIGAIH